MNELDLNNTAEYSDLEKIILKYKKALKNNPDDEILIEVINDLESLL